MSGRGTRTLLAGLAVAGLLVSAYLTWSHLRGAAPLCVGGGSGCETVQASRYSEVLGIPVAALGLLGYAALLYASVNKGERAALTGLFVALVGTLYSGYLTWLELFVIRAICQWCVVSAGTITAALVLSIFRVRQGEVSW